MEVAQTALGFQIKGRLKLDLKFQTAFRLEIDRAIELGMIVRSNESCCLKAFMELVPCVKLC